MRAALPSIFRQWRGGRAARLTVYSNKDQAGRFAHQSHPAHGGLSSVVMTTLMVPWLGTPLGQARKRFIHTSRASPNRLITSMLSAPQWTTRRMISGMKSHQFLRVQTTRRSGRPPKWWTIDRSGCGKVGTPLLMPVFLASYTGMVCTCFTKTQQAATERRDVPEQVSHLS